MTTDVVPVRALNIVTLAETLPRRRGVSLVVVSILLHVVALALLVVVPLLTSDPLPEPSQVRAFLVEAPALAPPPPPPPPPAPRAQAAPRTVAEPSNPS